MEPTYQIPFNRSSLQGRELEYILRTMSIGQIAGDQTYSKQCQTFLEQVLGVPKAMVTTSCTHALELSALLLDIQPGDEVIVPSFTFVSTANAFALRGAKIVFADIRPDTLNLDKLTAWAIRKALARTKWQRARTAKLLGITRETLRAKMNRYGIKREPK